MARRGRLLPDLRISAPLGRCTHIDAGVLPRRRRDRFSTIDERGRRCLREPAHAVGEWPRAMARRGRLLPDLRISAPLGRCMHIGAGGRRDRFSTIDKRDRRCLPEPAHAVGEWPRAMARRSRLLPDPRISAAPMLAGTHIGVGARHDRFSTIDKWGQPGLREPAHGLGE
jgi:hypothetical protein